MRRIAAFVPNVVGFAPGQRIRIESWAPRLESYGWTVDLYPFEDDRLHQILYEPQGNRLSKFNGIVRCYARQVRRVLGRVPCDAVLVYREAALAGAVVVERLARRLNTPIVYDIDDPIWIPYRSPANGWFSLLKWSSKTRTLLSLSDRVICINRLIADYARRFNRDVTVVPNCVDVAAYSPCPRNDRLAQPRLVWMGSQSTMANLTSIADPIRRIQQTHGTALTSIGVGTVDLPGVHVDAREWSASTEIADLRSCDIGLVPVPESSWNRWKFFLKVVQYLSVGLPVIASDVGSNSEVVQNGVNGFLVRTADEWYERMQLLVENHDLRRRMSEAARKTAVERYSTDVHMPRLARIFDDAVARYQIQRRPA